MVQRGQKLREMSSVVLDEASYDPSLRFVLVAAALFLLFLVMVLLNRFIGKRRFGVSSFKFRQEESVAAITRSLPLPVLT